jgi:hypothetical protein
MKADVVSNLSRASTGSVSLVLLSICLWASAHASAAAYNPDNLPNGQAERLGQICQTVLGLRPSEPSVPGIHPGTPHLDPNVSHYQGCIASLSDAVQRIGDAGIARRADADCRAKGLRPDSSELAICVLQTAKSYAAEKPASDVSQVPNSTEPAGQKVRSFFYASPRELLQREQVACAQLGLEPGKDEFSRCVKGLETTFFAIDNPLD